MALSIREHVALGPLVTLKTGGAARYFTTAETVEDIKEAVYFAEQNKLPLFVLGGGSNLLVSEEGFSGLVVQLKLKGITYASQSDATCKLTAAAGEELDVVIADSVARGLWGLENLSHIPGSIGATPVQNVGAYGVEVADIILEVTVFDCVTKKIFTMSNSECYFLYRHSIFKEKNNLIILLVTFMLSALPNPKVAYADLAQLSTSALTPQAIRDCVIGVRASKFPDWHTVGTAGSFFKNPVIPKAEVAALLLKYPDLPTYPAANGQIKVSLGYILDKICGLKGFTLGHVRLYEKQALVLVADAGATTQEIKNFKNIISKIVFEKTFITIEQEVTEI